MPLCKGKYTACLEGDDYYWTDPYKLQKQADFLEANEDFSICVHHCNTFYQNSGEIIESRNSHLFTNSEVGLCFNIQESNIYILKLIEIMDNENKSVTDLMEVLKLNGRRSFLQNYLKPAIQAGYVSLLYPDKPTHRNQRYYLTKDGLDLLKTPNFKLPTNL